MINKIKSINCASYKNYTWEDGLENFKNINIFYGHNGAGKTMLSRIMRCFEQKELNQDYENMAFEIEFDGKKFSQDDIQSANLPLVVYNKDFINDNLRFLINGKKDGNIKSFSSVIINKDNSKIFEEIEKLQNKLGEISNEEQGVVASGLYGDKERIEKTIRQKEKEKQGKDQDDKLRNKASEIKNDKAISEINYNLTKIRQDIEKIKDNLEEHILTPEIENQCRNSLKDEVKEELLINFTFNEDEFSDILIGSKELIEQKFVPKEYIETNLRKWLNEGLDLHEHDTESQQECKFCKNKLSKERLEWLIDNLKDSGIDKNSNDINLKLEKLSKIRSRHQSFLNITNKLETSNFYTDYKDECEKLKTEFSNTISNYFGEIFELGRLLQTKRDNPYDNISFKNFQNHSQKMSEMLEKTYDLMNKNNDKTKNLETTKKETSEKIKFHIIAKFIKEINYLENLRDIEQIDTDINSFKVNLTIKEQEIEEYENKIKELRNSMSNEQASADKINEYLKSHFGNNVLEFRAVEENRAEFKIYRNGAEADNLSEGECSLVGFCYFMAKLQNADKKSVAWIDDPISSLDSNHIFFIFSLIDSELFENKDLKFNQLFISTHNLDFLKYLKKLKSVSSNKRSLYIIEKNENGSQIKDMPKFLKNYTTEFNYLFEQIYNHKNIGEITDEDIKTTLVYNFGNNLRKFLEIYLFFKYPTEKSFGTEVIEKFFKSESDKTIQISINRYANEFSHLREILERGMKPLDIPESKKIAEFVLKTIKLKDPEQFKALCESIGKSDELSE
ncbi:AAA family ATPase [Campylobacter concisus]|uniref:AAA family ATPase n=1 Tax=Campylobacter concisus TaxID=199 RepID=UPI001883B4EF|nr:AAA family ATPase [Campylobacter concisus]MBE9817547.1 AAA family ATPase [Campylobacter concisus]